VEADQTDITLLHVVSHTTTQQSHLLFDDDVYMQNTSQSLVNAKTRVRSYKMVQILDMLHDDV
jgi:hypothetical protein